MAWFDPNGAREQPGQYAFRVDKAESKTFKNGRSGAVATLTVDADGHDARCFHNLAPYGAGLPRVKAFYVALGLDPESPGELDDLVGRIGRANFTLNDRGYLEVESFCSAAPLAEAEDGGAKVPF